jgi:hypothetical protein
MLELVPFNLKNKLPRDFRLPSLAGTGLPERMRTTAFAFLGLTAAAGLALVAIFAQVSFHVLSPAPLPNEPAGGNAVAEAVALDPSPGAFVPVVRSRVGNGDVGSDGAINTPASDPGRGDNGSSPAGGTAPAGPAPDGGGAAAQPAETTPPDPVPVAAGSTPGSAPGPESEPVSEPVPAPSGPSKPAPTPARPAAPTPVAPSGPGNSSSGAAAAHASERGVEASSKPAATVEPPPPATSSSPTPSTSTTSAGGNGKALGHAK